MSPNQSLSKTVVQAKPVVIRAAAQLASAQRTLADPVQIQPLRIEIEAAKTTAQRKIVFAKAKADELKKDYT